MRSDYDKEVHAGLMVISVIKTNLLCDLIGAADYNDKNVWYEVMGVIGYLSGVKHSLFPRVTKRSLLAHYLPLAGAIGHTCYMAHILTPHLLSSLIIICRYLGLLRLNIWPGNYLPIFGTPSLEYLA
ncbi:unnamed protein product [Dracunculus medinensis]|uniref:Ribonuclease H n=1 Tax=Dracunculus medinensis TaxID=318479 RepID=A0A0N4UB57_DRAME|nr:unnamed protein product [Dracunculus medinensis]